MPKKLEERPDEGVPQPPPFQRKLQIAPLQLIGIPLLALLPLLALFGFFSERITVVNGTNDEIAIQVEYVSRNRYKMEDSIVVAVTNLSPHSSATITVAFDREYLEHFSELSFVPDVTQLTEKSYEIELAGVESGETRLVEIEMKSEHYGTKTGTISASLSDGQSVTVPVSTMIYP